VAPLLGPEFGLALAHAGRDWYVFSTEALARAHAGRLPQEAPLEADALLLADWSRLASEAREVAYWMAQEDLLPGRNLEDVEKGLGAALFGLAELGECRIEARRDGRELRLSGWLARETDAEASGL
jgi:hypothetical protein